MNNKSTIQTQINAETSRSSNKTQMNRTVVGSATTAPAAPAPLRSAPAATVPLPVNRSCDATVVVLSRSLLRFTLYTFEYRCVCRMARRGKKVS
ncbi:hypothetical protein Hanom_Chr17g01526041 [Helianthus anomalus]